MAAVKLLKGEWMKLPVSFSELCLDTTLRCGQSFRWKKLEDEWTCVLKGQIYSLRQDEKYLHYRVSRSLLRTASPDEESKNEPNDPNGLKSAELVIRNYLNLEPNLTELYEKWSIADPNFKKRAPKFTGVRILKQDAWETIAGFICSSNNNIARISQMVTNLCLHYGPYVGTLHDHALHDFPSPDALSGPGVEQHLRELGFGYRAKYLATTARMIAKEKPENWLESITNPEPFQSDGVLEVESGGRPGYRRAHEELLTLQGVGPKVADCICLMGLGWGEAVPVDTHVWQIAQRDYKFGKGKHKSLTKATYDAIGSHFRDLWGKEAGWAHSVLFAADLKTFAVRLVEKTEVKDEVSVKEEQDIVVKVETTKKRKAMEEEMVKDEPIDEKDILTETKTKRTRITRSTK